MKSAFAIQITFAAILVAAIGCRRLARLDRESAPHASATTTESATPPSPRTAAAPVREVPGPPDGYVAVAVLRVVPTAQGNAVLLEDDDGGKIVPIFVGGTEALSIELRHDGKRYQRPLTHDLLDTLLDKLGGELVKVHVDDLKDNTFVGRVFVRQGERIIDVDARPSDAIALALGSKTPIFVSRKVVDKAGIRKGDLEKEGGGLPSDARDRPRPDPISL